MGQVQYNSKDQAAQDEKAKLNSEELEELMDKYYAWMEDDKKTVRRVLAEDAVGSLPDDFAQRADDALNPKPRTKLKGKRGAGKRSIFERLHKTGEHSRVGWWMLCFCYVYLFRDT